MFQKGTGERFKYKKAILEKYPQAICEKRLKWFAVFINGKRFSEAFNSAESAWADAWIKLQSNKK